MSRNEFYNLWYTLRRPQWDTGKAPDELLNFIQAHPPGRALDLGCGTGTSVIALAFAGWQATGVDFAPQAVKLARKKAREAGVTAQYRVGDVTRVRFAPESFDLILDVGCFQGLEERHENYIRNVRRWLAPGGVFLLYSLIRKPDIPEFGITEADIKKFPLSLRNRIDGFNRGPVTRASVWLEFVKENQ